MAKREEVVAHEKEVAEKAVKEAGGNKYVAAESLGISIATLYRQLKGK